MESFGQFELHSFSGDVDPVDFLSPDEFDVEKISWQEGATPAAQVLVVPQQEDGEPFWVCIDRDSGCPKHASPGDRPVAGFRPVRRRFGSALAMLNRGEGILVNGLPALSFTVLSPRDALVLQPGLHSYVTERVRPFVGKPTPKMLGQKCPFCRIPVDAETRVVTCRCGVQYHSETAESHPAVAETDRLNCFEKVRVCLSCGRQVTLDESLVWDPATL